MTGRRAAITMLWAAGTIGITACAGHPPLRESEMAVESRVGWPVERCAALEQPVEVPALHRLADTSRLPAFDALEGLLSFSVEVSARGDVESARLLLAGALTPEVRREWEDRMMAVLQQQEPQPLPWTVRVNRAEGGTWSVERSIYCSPRVAQSPGFARFTGTARPRGSHSVEVRVTVSETGFGQSVHLPNPPPNRDFDANIRQHAMTLRFLPATLNGEPVPSTFTYWVTPRRTRALR